MDPSTSTETPLPAVRSKIALALGTIYLVWGSTFLGNRIAVAFIPPFLLASLRFLSAGLILSTIGKCSSKEVITRQHWKSALIIGTLLLTTGNGLMVWAQQRIASGLTSLVISTVPLWMVCLPALVSRKHRPTPRIFIGLALGLLGVGILIPWPSGSVGGADTFSYLALVVAALSWSLGTLYSKRAPLPKNATVSAGMEMLSGGFLLLVLSGARGEWTSFHPQRVPLHAWLSLAYLTGAGSVIAFSAYRWLIPRISMARLSTYAYINPLVAVVLGRVVLGEPLSVQMILGAFFIFGSVGLISYADAPKDVRPRRYR